jgi:hypothetical protein
MLELRRVSKVCGQGTQRAEAAVMRAQRTANEPTLSRAYVWESLYIFDPQGVRIELTVQNRSLGRVRPRVRFEDTGSVGGSAWPRLRRRKGLNGCALGPQHNRCTSSPATPGQDHMVAINELLGYKIAAVLRSGKSIADRHAARR